MSKKPNEHYGLLFDVRRSIRYHNRRRAFFDRLHTLSSAASLVFGSAVVASLLGQYTAFTAAAGVVVTVFSCADLVAGSTQKARLHWDLARRFADLEKSLIKNARPDTEAMRKMQEERLSIEADEPPVLRVLDCLCYNEMIKAEGRPPEKEATPISRRQRLFAQWFDIAPESIRLQASTDSPA
jgi:hypothetical protein